ncbi:MAG: aconitate hydratase [Smithellaceae bacterium]|nr:aconitate hydratase [Smithellaceae bacterium]
MGLTVAEKIIAASLADGEMKRGHRIGIRVSQTLTHDVTGVMSYLAFEAIGQKRVKTELSVSYIDHNILQADFRNPDDHRFLLDIARQIGVICTRPASGICHQLHLERFARPGKSLLGSDSHTMNAGGIGMLAIGAGGLDVAVAMAGEPFFFQMPRMVKVFLRGQLPPFVSAKNVILEVLRRISVKGGLNAILEYAGPGVLSLNVTERATICNMGAETGATTSLFPSDDITLDWLRAQGRAEDWAPISADEDALYDDLLEIDLSKLEPLIALPHAPDNVVTVREAAGTEIDQVMFGGCTNSSLQDILSTAHILGGHKVHDRVDAAIYCGSRQVMLEGIARGAIDALARSGVRIMELFCGACNGMGFAPPTNGISLRTGPRNFIGRCGNDSASVYLVGPEVAAASALAGRITDPRDLAPLPRRYEMPARFLIDDSLFLMPAREPVTEPIRRGPNIPPLPPLKALPARLQGTVILKVGDHVTTDHIVPAGAHFLPIRNNIPELSKHVFRVLDETFPERARKAGEGFIVAGENYGQGSSREQAALAPRYLGIRAVIAKGFARIHLANLVNFGLLPFVFVLADDYRLIHQEDALAVDTRELREGETYTIRDITRGIDIPVKLPLSQEELAILKAGGRLNWLRQKETHG